MSKNGLSAIICTQNDERTIALCLQGFASFADETIVVVNNSTDKTWDIVMEFKLENPDYNIITMKLDGISDLSEARQAGYAVSSCSWIIRADGDFICYTELDGEFSPLNFKRALLKKRVFLPTVYYVPQLNVFRDYNTVGDGIYSFSPFDEPPMPRIYSRNKLLKFQRLGRDEGVPYARFYKRKYLTKPIWIHATLKSKVDIRLSHAWRRDWRQLGDFQQYPTLMSYINLVKLPECYPGLSLEEASDKFYSEKVMPSLKPLPLNSKWPIPNHIREPID